MVKSMQLLLAFVAIVLLSILGVWTVVYAQSGAVGLTPVEINEIKNAVEHYFEIRYRALSAIHQDEPGNLVSRFTDGSPFLKTELDKLEVELQHARQHHLEYSQYKFLLDFTEISIDPATRIVSVSVVEGHDVVFEISKELSKTDPVISSMRNLQHSIKMRKEQNEWRIVSDQYNDYLWRFMKATGLDKDNLLQSMKLKWQVQKRWTPHAHFQRITRHIHITEMVQ